MTRVKFSEKKEVALEKKYRSMVSFKTVSHDDDNVEEDHADQSNDAAEESASSLTQDTENTPSEEKTESDDSNDSEIEISFADQEPESEEDKIPAAPWVKQLRKTNRELQRQNREFQEKLNRFEQSSSQKEIELGPKPTLESCDYDSDKFEIDIDKWHERKRVIDEKNREIQNAQKKTQDEWESELSKYQESKKSLNIHDYDDVEADVTDRLSVTQQGIVVHGSQNPTHIIYALGKNPKKLHELSTIEDPIKFAFAIARLETQLKVTKRAPSPERKNESVASGLGANSSAALDRLEAAAAISGDRSAILAYKRTQRNQK